MEKPKLELSEAYRKSRGSVSILSGIALAWAAAQFEFSVVKLPILGDVVLSQYAIPIILAVSVTFSMIRCTTEFMMQSVEVRKWQLAQFDYKITLVISSVSILLLAAAGVTRSINTMLAVIAIGLLLAAAFFLGSFVLTMIIMPISLYLRRRRHSNPSVARAAFAAFSYASLISGLGIIAVIAVGGSNLLFRGYEYFGLTETPHTIPVLVFLFTAILFVFVCVFHDSLLKKVFAFEPAFKVKTTKGEDGTVKVTFERNETSPEIKPAV